MDKIILKNNKRKHTNNLLNTEKESVYSKYKSTTNIKNQSQKDDISQSAIEKLNKQIENLKFSIKKCIYQDSNSFLIKNINNIISKISEISKELNSQINQYQNTLSLYESKIRDFQGKLFVELLNKEILNNNIINLSQKEKDYELIKEKTGIIVNNGEIINTNRKDNEIIILRTENSTLKGVIEKYEKKLVEKEKEYKKINMNLTKEKNELISKINILNKKIFKRQNSSYSRYNISKNKLNINNKKSYEFSGSNINDSNDLMNNNNPFTINVLKTNDNNYYINNSNKIIFGDVKMNTISATHMHKTFNNSRKNSNYNSKLKNKFMNFIKENNNAIKENEKINNAIINKTFSRKRGYSSNKKKKTSKIINNNNIYNKIILKENKKIDIKNTILKTDRTKTKSKEHNLSTFENIYIKKNKPCKKIIHKKTNSSKISNIPFNYNTNQINDRKDNTNISNKENNKNAFNLVNIKNLILNKGKIKRSNKNNNKINLIYRNLLHNNISNSENNNNNSRNSKLKNNIPKLYTFNTSKVPTPKSFIC